MQRLARLALSPAIYFAIALGLVLPITGMALPAITSLGGELASLIQFVFLISQSSLSGLALLIGIQLFLMRDIFAEYWPATRPWMYRRPPEHAEATTSSPPQPRRLVSLLRSPIAYALALFGLYATESSE